MRIVFVQNIWREYYGVMMLCAVLDRKGHSSEIIIDHSPQNAAKRALELHPDCIGFSFTNCERDFAKKTASKIKALSPGTVTIAGGPDPTLHPGMIDNSDFDAICIGEGERVIVEFAHALDERNSFDRIEGIHTQGNEYKVGPLVEELETLPFPDRSRYYRYPFLRKNPVRFFFTGRGCPFSCSFCFNKAIRNLYPNQNRYVRHFSPERVIEVIRIVKDQYGAKIIRFEDDVFTLDKKWLHAFLPLYQSKIGLPFLSYIRADIDEKSVALLKRSGCRSVLFGIETGDEKVRQKLLKKNISDLQINRAAALLHKYRLHFFTTNMLGLPGESWALALKTIRINQKIKVPDTWCSIFQPYTGLPLTSYAMQQGQIDSSQNEQIGQNTFDRNTLPLPDSKRIFNLHKFFYPLARWPWMESILLPLTRLRPNLLFHYIFVFFYVYSYRQHTDVGIGRLFSEGLHWFRLFFREKRNIQKDG